MASEPLETAPLIVQEAMRRALAGDPVGGGMLLVPLIEDSRRECYALCGMLATTALIGIEPPPENHGVVLVVEDTATGMPGHPEDLPPDAQFAAQFVTAWADKDQDAALALFEALAVDADTEAGTCRVVDGVLSLYGMAIASVRALVEERRDNPNHRKD
ncbi:hypothetical protein ABZ499_33085 [Streptomyces sp. NPDC019990]|uniref:hypothetical protein n=1 Tax=Streptomyces sp. NPDC019990 TaxID=3154693 RepID=UPI0033E9C94C